MAISIGDRVESALGLRGVVLRRVSVACHCVQWDDGRISNIKSCNLTLI